MNNKKLIQLKEKAMKSKKDTYSFHTLFYGIPMIVAVNGKTVRAIAKNGKRSFTALAKRKDIDARDDIFGTKVAKLRAAKAVFKDMKSQLIKSMTNEIAFIEDQLKLTVSSKYPE